MKKDYYSILDVLPTASNEEIKKAKIQWAKLYHRDRLAELDEEGKKRAEKKLADINDAFDTISNPEKRRRYDQEVEAEKRELRQRQEQERADAEKKSQYQRIQELFERGDIEGALKEAKSLYACFPDDADCQNNYAALLYEWATRLAEKGKFKEAEAQLRQAAEHTLDDKLKVRIRADLELLKAKVEGGTSPPPRTAPKFHTAKAFTDPAPPKAVPHTPAESLHSIFINFLRGLIHGKKAAWIVFVFWYGPAIAWWCWYLYLAVQSDSNTAMQTINKTLSPLWSPTRDPVLNFLIDAVLVVIGLIYAIPILIITFALLALMLICVLVWMAWEILVPCVKWLYALMQVSVTAQILCGIICLAILYRIGRALIKSIRKR